MHDFFEPMDMWRLIGTLWLAVLVALTGGPVWADKDQDRARSALLAGEVLPLPVILERVGRQYPGQVLEVELEREHGEWVYELKWLQPGGTLLKLEVDARDGSVLKRRQEKRER